ncbi:hypothetical protein SAMN02746089_02515 [Caldanaerobius fijiensis DSM 17918]|uniref:DUF4258 domain-containing protein n=1 Tax=Caldanaerobius fijiensis DSM 17918 TaxID=1121256 RepID=A0A1M5EBB5_9THEO|nr:hypothetical protein [Caldanaerobius fijiensis]SHF76487.1 hypothetical protein SAMN02746089_02515 [Caldanaerobius fijiensis DSM 17918]
MFVQMWGCDVDIQFSKHALKRISERNILKEIIINDLITSENKIGELKNNQRFALIDKTTNTTIIAQIRDFGETIMIITVVDKAEKFKTKYHTDVIIYIN